MNNLMIRCPVTGRMTATGVVVHDGSTTVVSQSVLGHCMECDGQHTWSTPNAEDDAEILGEVLDPRQRL